MAVSQREHGLSEGIPVAVAANHVLDGLGRFVDDQDERDAFDLAALQVAVEEMALSILRVVDGEGVAGGPALHPDEWVALIEEVRQAILARPGELLGAAAQDQASSLERLGGVVEVVLDGIECRPLHCRIRDAEEQEIRPTLGDGRDPVVPQQARGRHLEPLAVLAHIGLVLLGPQIEQPLQVEGCRRR